MTKYLFLLVLIWAGDLWAQKNIEPISPRYIFVEKDNGEYEYHEISHFYESGSYSPKIKNQKIMLYGDSYCLIINDFKHLTLKRHLKNELNQPFALHGYVVKKSDVKHIEKKNPAPRYACPNETTANKVQIKPGISKSVFDKLQEKEKLSQADLKETVTAKVFHDMADPYHKVCDELKDLKSLFQILHDAGYLEISMKTKDKNLVIPIHTGLGAPYIFTKNYKLHKDHKIPYYRRDVNVALTEKAETLISEAEKLIQEQEAREDELLIKQFAKILGEEINLPGEEIYYEEKNHLKDNDIPPYIFTPVLAKNFEKYIKVPVKGSKNIYTYKKILIPQEILKGGARFISRAVWQSVLASITLDLFGSATDPNEIEKSIAENPFNLIATIDENEEKEACRRALYNPDSYQSLMSLFIEFQETYNKLYDYENLMQYRNAFEIYDEERASGKDGINQNKTQDKTKVFDN